MLEALDVRLQLLDALAALGTGQRQRAPRVGVPHHVVGHCCAPDDGELPPPDAAAELALVSAAAAALPMLAHATTPVVEISPSPWSGRPSTLTSPYPSPLKWVP